MATEEYENKWNEQTQIPDGQTLIYHSLFIADIFPVNKLDELKIGLDQLFSEDSSAFRQLHVRDYEEFLRKAKASYYGTGWLNIGHVVSKKYEKTKGVVTGPIVNLPKYVDSISFMLVQSIPSYVTLSMQVVFDDDISKDITTVFSEYYKEKREPKGLGFTIYSSDRLKKMAVQSYLSSINMEVEYFLAERFKGSFLRNASPNPVCPFIRLFSLSQIPISDDENLLKWIEENRHFLGTFDIIPISWFCYKDGDYFLIESDDKILPPNVFIFTSRDIFEQPGKINGYGTTDRAITYEHDIPFLVATEFLCFSKLIDIKLSKVSSIRASALSQVSESAENEKTLDHRSFKNEVNDYKQFVETATNISRLDQELDEMLKNERYLYREIPEFSPLEEKRKKDNKHYFQYIVDYIERRRKIMSKEVLFLTDFFRTQFSITKNLSDFRTQDQIRKLTMITVALVIIQLTILLITSIKWASITNFYNFFKLILRGIL